MLVGDGSSSHCKTFYSGNPMDQIIIHIRLCATHFKFNSLKPYQAERSDPFHNNYDFCWWWCYDFGIKMNITSNEKCVLFAQDVRADSFG